MNVADYLVVQFSKVAAEENFPIAMVTGTKTDAITHARKHIQSTWEGNFDGITLVVYVCEDSGFVEVWRMDSGEDDS